MSHSIKVVQKVIYVCRHILANTLEGDQTTREFSYVQQKSYWGSIFGAWIESLNFQVEQQNVEGIRNGTILLGLDGLVTKGKGASSF